MSRSEVVEQDLTDAVLPIDKTLGAVVVSLSDPVDQILTSLAVMNAGGTAVIVDPRKAYLLGENAELLEQVGSLATDWSMPYHWAERLTTVASAMSSQPLSYTDQLGVGGRIVFLTSGSTARPKAVAFHRDQVHFLLDTVSQLLPYDSSRTVSSSINPSFDYGFYQLLLAVRGGCDAYLDTAGALLPSMVANIRSAQGPVLLPLTPGLLSNLVTFLSERDERIHSVGSITLTGGVVSSNLLVAASRVFPNATMIPMYGLTECKRVSIATASDQFTGQHHVPDGSGQPLPGTEVVASEIDGEIEEIPPGQTGELVVRGPHVAHGYWPTNTGETFTRSPDGKWTLRTGDLGYIDEQGRVHILGRVNGDAIKIDDERVSLSAIRQILTEHPEVLHAEVGAISSRNGNRIGAVCAIRSGDLHDIETWLEGRVTKLLMRSIDIEVATDLALNARSKVTFEP